MTWWQLRLRSSAASPSISRRYRTAFPCSLARARLTLNHRGTRRCRLQIGEQPLEYRLDRDTLILRQRLERRQLEQVTLRDLTNAPDEHTIVLQMLKDLLETLQVPLPLVALRFGDAISPIEQIMHAIAREQSGSDTTPNQDTPTC
jgi:hypothetical protein